MKKATLFLVPFLFSAIGLAHPSPTLPNPGPVTTAITRTSIVLTWPPVPGATSYGVWRQSIDGTYGQQFEKIMTITEPTLSFMDLAPGTGISLGLTTDDNPGIVGNFTFVSARTLMPPIWRNSIPNTYGQGAAYAAALNYDGEPAPKLSLVDSPPGMEPG